MHSDSAKYLGLPPDRSWLEKLREDVLEPELPIIDAHHHLWDHAGDRYLLDEMLADTGAGHNILGTVYVQAFAGYRHSGPEEMRPVGETEFAAAFADECVRRGSHTQLPAGIVSYAELLLGDRVAPVLEAHVEAGGGRFRGIRRIAARDHYVVSVMYPQPPLGMLMEPRFHDGMARLKQLGLSFDCFIFHTQLHELAVLADACPDVPIVLNHCGSPLGIGPYAGKRQEIFDIWAAGLRNVAKRPNVFLKIGGMAIKLFGFGFNDQVLPPSSGELAAAWKPYVETGIAAFGVERCMFEVNFPPDKGGCSYVSAWNAFKRLTVSASADERAALFHDTARRFYRLDI